MKHLLAISILLCFGSNLFAQPYQSIFGSNDSTTEWVYVWHETFGWNNDTVFVQGDTTINGVTYKKIAQTYYLGDEVWFLLREDVNSGTVWCRSVYSFGQPDDTVDRIMMRMDLNVGDTFDISNIRLLKGSYPDSFNVVDSIRYINGLKHIYFKGVYANYNEPYTLVEGVGPNMGIYWKFAIMPAHSGQGSYYLLCSYKNGQKTGYQNKAFGGTCWQFSNIKEQLGILDNSITFYPQPANVRVNINNKTNKKITKVIIVSQTGTVMNEVTASSITTLETGTLPAGNYFLQLYSADGYLTTKSIVIM